MSNISQFLANPARQVRYLLSGIGAGASTAVWTAPSTITTNEVLVVCVGGGGAGGAGNAGTPGISFGSAPLSGGGGGGGGSGAIAGYVYTVGAGTTISLTAGGTGGTSSANNQGPTPVPISATGGSAGGTGSFAYYSSTGGSGGSGGSATIPGPASVNNAFSISGMPGVPGDSGSASLQSSPYIGAIAGGAGGAGGVNDGLLSFFNININQVSGQRSLGGSPNPTMVSSPSSVALGSRNPSTNGLIGCGGGGGCGGDFAIASSLGGSPSPGSFGAVFVIY